MGYENTKKPLLIDSSKDTDEVVMASDLNIYNREESFAYSHKTLRNFDHRKIALKKEDGLAEQRC